MDQKIADSNSPKTDKNQSIMPVSIGPTNIDAKNIWPMSLLISDKVFNRAEESSIFFIIYYNS